MFVSVKDAKPRRCIPFEDPAPASLSTHDPTRWHAPRTCLAEFKVTPRCSHSHVTARDASQLRCGRRKVAIPLPDGMTWDAFLQQVMAVDTNLCRPLTAVSSQVTAALSHDAPCADSDPSLTW